MRQKIAMLLAAFVLGMSAYAQAPSFARGADVSWCTEMEASGKQFYDASGNPTELMALLRQCGMNAIRLRVWVNPETAYGAWCDKADVVAKAKRAHSQGMALLLDFHYSDFFADPSRQTMPKAWQGLTQEQLKAAVANHTKDVLEALKAEGIEPAWVQVGNETRSGMLWESGRIDWNKSGAASWSGYVAVSNAGYEAVKAVVPSAKVIVHIDKGPEDNAWFFKDFKQYGGKFDMIGLSHYPEGSWQSENARTAANVKTLSSQFGVPVMIVETGYNVSDESLAAQVMTDLFSRLKGSAACAGIFYWEPEVYAWWRPSYYTTLGWNAYNKGAFTWQGRPSTVLDAFYDPTDAVAAPRAEAGTSSDAAYDLSGRKVSANRRGIVIKRSQKIVRQ